MLINDWIVGETAVLPLDIVDAAGVAIVPATIRLRIKPPGRPVQTIDNPPPHATGRYKHLLDLDAKGAWYYRWEVTAGGAVAAVEGSITVDPSRFA